MTDEEKKAIEYLKIEYEKLMKEDNILFPLYKSDAKRLIDIIEKQSKEIEELKNITKSYDSFLGDEKIVIADKKFFVNGYFQENFVRKDKIKAKIEEYKKDGKIINQTMPYCGEYINHFEIKALQSLLEKE